MIKAIHIAGEKLHQDAWIPPFREALEELLDLTILEEGNNIKLEARAQLIREYDILLTNWKSPLVPESLIEQPGNLKYICNISGSVRKFISRRFAESHILLSNWGDAPAFKIAEGAFSLLMTLIKDIPKRKKLVEEGGWVSQDAYFSSTLEGLHVGLYGLGAIGKQMIRFLEPFNPVIHIFDPYIPSIPSGCVRVNSLKELFSSCSIVSLHAGLSDETQKSVTRELLALLPDGGIIINTARGAIIDEKALFVELEKGRLKAGLDVLIHDYLKSSHAARSWQNLILTGHDLGKVHQWAGQPQPLQGMHTHCLENIKRYIYGEEILFQIDTERYDRST